MNSTLRPGCMHFVVNECLVVVSLLWGLVCVFHIFLNLICVCHIYQGSGIGAEVNTYPSWLVTQFNSVISTWAVHNADSRFTTHVCVSVSNQTRGILFLKRRMWVMCTVVRMHVLASPVCICLCFVVERFTQQCLTYLSRVLSCPSLLSC